MNRYIFMTCIAILIGLSFYGVSIPAEEATVNEDHLNVRNGPGKEHDKIGQVHTDESFDILAEEDGWVKIQLPDTKGWVTEEYITTSSDPSDKGTHDRNKAPLLDGESFAIKEENTHIRTGPSTEEPITAYADKGDEFSVISQEGNWYKVENDDISGFIHYRLIGGDTKQTPSDSLENKTIVIDAGHGGKDVGAVGTSDTYEKDFTYITTMQLKRELEMIGANVVLTRNVDDFVSLYGRTSLANVLDTDAFISIHYNSTPELPNVSGIGTYYYHDQDEGLADAVHENVIDATGAVDREVAFDNFHVIRQTFKPSILLELGFLSNKEEEKLLRRKPYQKKIVTGIAKGLQEYFRE